MKKIALLTTLFFSTLIMHAQCDFFIQLYDDSGMLDETATTLCQGESYGLKAEINSGCTPLISYDWSNGETADSIGFTVDLATPGVFDVTITYGTMGSQDTEARTITLGIGPELSAGVDGPDFVCSGETAELLFIGTPEATVIYEIDGVESTVMLDNTGEQMVTTGAINTAITVEVTGVELDGCTAMVTRSIDIDVQEPPSLAPVDNVSVCDSYTFPTISGSGTVDAAYFSESGGMGVSYDPGDEIMTGGTYYVFDSGNGCPAEVEFEVTINITPIAQINLNPADEEVCTLEEISFAATATGSAPTYTWNVDDFSTPLTGREQTNISWSTTGDKSIRLTVEENGCSDTDGLEVVVNQTPDASVFTTTDELTEVNCRNEDDFRIMANPGFSSYMWSTTDGNIIGSTNDVTIRVNAEGTYEVTISENGCEDDGSITITEDRQDPTVVILPENPEISCDATSIELTADPSAQGAVTYLWSTNATTSSISVEVAATYDVTIIDQDNGCRATASTTVNGDSDIPMFGIMTDDDPDRTITCLVPEIEILADNLGNGFSYEWSTDDGGFVSVDLMNPSVIVDRGGTYAVTVTNEDNNCTNTGLIMIEENRVFPNFNPSSNIETITCDDDEAILSANVVGGGSFSYDWENELGEFLGDDAMISVRERGVYSVTVTNDINGCSDNDNVEVEENLVFPEVDINETVNPLTCEATMSVLNTMVNNATNVSYDWSPGNVPDVANPSISSGGTYTVIVTNEDNGCASDPESVTINVDQNLPSNVFIQGSNNLLTCLVEEITLEVDPDLVSNENPDIVWSTGAINVDQIFVTVPGNYQVTVTDPANGCFVESDFFVVGLNRERPVITQIQIEKLAKGCLYK